MEEQVNVVAVEPANDQSNPTGRHKKNYFQVFKNSKISLYLVNPGQAPDGCKDIERKR